MEWPNDHKFKWLWMALGNGNAELVRQNDPGAEFNWNCSSELFGTPLMAAIFAGSGTSFGTDFVCEPDDAFETRLCLIRWMIREKAADPRVEESAGCRAFKGWNIKDFPWGHSYSTKQFRFAGHSALSALFEAKHAMQTAPGGVVWNKDMKRIDRLLKVFSETKPRGKRPRMTTVPVHEAVVDTWESFMEEGPGKDLTLRCLQKGEVQGEILVHSGILAGASLVAKAMLSGQMRERSAMSIDIDCRLDSMKLLVALVYTGCVLEAEGKEQGAPSIEATLGCLEVAHRWNIRHVVDLMVTHLCNNLSVETLAKVWELAVLTHEDDLLTACRSLARNSETEVRPLYEAGGHFSRLVEQDLAEHIFPDAARSRRALGALDAEANTPPRRRRRLSST